MSGSRSMPLYLMLLGISALLSPPVKAQEEGEKAGISVRVTPERATPGDSVLIDGVAPPDGTGTVHLEIRKPDGKSVVLDVVSAANGDYSTAFTGTETAGEYIVTATLAKGRATGRGEFSIEVMESLDEAEEAEEELKIIKEMIEDILSDVTTQIELLPDSPPKDATRKKLAESIPKIKAAIRDFGEIDELVEPLRELTANPKTRDAVKPYTHELQQWTERSKTDRGHIQMLLNASRRSNVRCEAIERAVEGFNFAAALANLMGGSVGGSRWPLNMIAAPVKGGVQGVAVDYLSSKGGDLANNIKKRLGSKAGDNTKFSATEVSKVMAGATEAHARNLFKPLNERVLFRAQVKSAAASSAMSLAFDAASFVGQQAFAAFCEKFSGNFKGKMHAEFFNVKATPWWEYEIEFEGHLELRYAKTPKGESSLTGTAVNGEFIGQAISFKMKERALESGAEGMMNSTLRFRRVLMPLPQLLNVFTGTLVNPEGRPAEEKPIEIEGKAAATFVRPYTFFVPVEGEIVDGVLSLRKKPATHDYKAAARVLYVVVTPLSPIIPIPIVFELPFKEGDFFLLRAMGDSGLHLKVEKTATALKIEEKITREKGNGRVNGKYELDIKLTNSGGK